MPATVLFLTSSILRRTKKVDPGQEAEVDPGHEVDQEAADHDPDQEVVQEAGLLCAEDRLVVPGLDRAPETLEDVLVPHMEGANLAREVGRQSTEDELHLEAARAVDHVTGALTAPDLLALTRVAPVALVPAVIPTAAPSSLLARVFPVAEAEAVISTNIAA